MYNIQNSNTITELRSATGLSISEGFPKHLKDDVQAVINVNPKDYRRASCTSGNRTTSGSITVLTTSATKDTYLIGCSMGFVKNAACDIATGQIAYVITESGKASSTNLFGIPVLTLTAQSENVVHHLSSPIKLARNTAVAVSSGGFAAGAMTLSGNVVYYEVEPFEN